MKRVFQLTLLITVFVILNGCSPQLQLAGLRAPANIQIDGQLIEWPNKKLAAYNSHSRIGYTICNDDDNLYLAVITDGKLADGKINYGGLFFNLSYKQEGKADTDRVSVVFPIADLKKVFDISKNTTRYNYQRYRNDSTAKMKRSQLDSIVSVINVKSSETFNKLKVTGVNRIPDSIINANSNDQGVKFAVQYDRTDKFIYEIAIPLKILGLPADGKTAFNYSLMLNGIRILENHGEPTIYYMDNRKLRGAALENSDVAYMQTTTKISGQYTLAKK